MKILSSLALATVLGLFVAAAHAQTQSVTVDTDAHSSTTAIQSGRSVDVHREHAASTRNGDSAADAVGAFAFGAF